MTEWCQHGLLAMLTHRTSSNPWHQALAAPPQHGRAAAPARQHPVRWGDLQLHFRRNVTYMGMSCIWAAVALQSSAQLHYSGPAVGQR